MPFYAESIQYCDDARAHCVNRMRRAILSPKKLNIKAIRFEPNVMQNIIYSLRSWVTLPAAVAVVVVCVLKCRGIKSTIVIVVALIHLSWCDIDANAKSLNFKLDFLAFCALVDLLHVYVFLFRCAWAGAPFFIQLIYGFNSIVCAKDVFCLRVSLCHTQKSHFKRWMRHVCANTSQRI